MTTASFPGLALLLLGACAAPTEVADAGADMPAQADAGPDVLRVLVWNIWRGGNEVDLGPEKIRAVIEDSGADVVLMQESYDIDGERPTTGRWLAAELGWSAHQASSPHLCVLTRLELEETFFHHDWHGLGARLVDGRGRELIAWSIWLDYRSYISHDVRDMPDASDEEVLAAEHERSGRLPQAEALLEHLREAGQLDEQVPLLVGGDWNTPSHLDWTVDTERVFERRRALPLPVSLAMEGAGFADAFRVVHPNPVQHPGITWTPLFRSEGGGGAQGFERIDRLYVKHPASAPGLLTPRAARVYPEVWEDDAIPVRERAFPSDHAAVLIEFAWGSASDSRVAARRDVY